ncbi:RNA polymerase II C-terminal domain phosphatase-like 1 isoform X1 [Papaver somniferum]|uniref:RNA polymerase II C-terminal domain phosphatase-like 1 isoform X1 n=1 Tax=Papaver somniferum TaxID=3469 RepID=UPI000E6FC456|nr:RNA polymerase II C-terminal domain phosphatase-like 1 isoform X1 [Papaver somniferum]
MFKSMVYEGNSLLGEVEIYPQNQQMDIIMLNKEIRISTYSQPSERCPPLAVLHTIAPNGVSFKMEASKSQSEDSLLYTLHYSLLGENKTAVMGVGEEELHLVAMPSRRNPLHGACFWGFYAPQGLYNSSLVMLNLRCLGIVFDLDETLIVANTMRSFEDRIDALQRKITTEMDPQRVSGMLQEIKRYQDDKIILKQYVETDQIVENGRLIKVQSEVFPALSDNHQPIIRPLIRLQEKNIILTRINPLIRDTSVLVRLRPAWEDLRSYLTARGRKRFEVYVCTMAERDYALEMWRLLDPESNLISSNELLNRIVCVKAGLRKSLLNVFHGGICDPKMALVIDDRLKVWDEIDQPRVHVVPAFAPYYAPQAEANNVVPVLCVARNVACNVRGGFFKDFDESLLQRIIGIFYEDDVEEGPSPPDVSNFLISEDDGTAANRGPLRFEGMADVEVERKLKDIVPAFSIPNSIDPRFSTLQQFVGSSSNPTVPQPSTQGSVMPFHDQQLQQQPQAPPSFNPVNRVGPSEASLQNSPAREEGEVPESELDPDTRRRLLILQHGQDIREHPPKESPPFPVRPPAPPVPGPPIQSRGNWFPSEEETSPPKQNRALPKQVQKDFSVESEAMHFENSRPQRSSSFQGTGGSVQSERTFHENLRLPKEVHIGDDRAKLSRTHPKYQSFSGEEAPLGRSASNNKLSPSPKDEEMPLARLAPSSKDLQTESGRGTSQYPDTPAKVLQDIAIKCGSKVIFRSALVASAELQFSIEVWFSGEKIGVGIGKTRKEAQRQAAERSLRTLANKYLINAKPDQTTVYGDPNKLSNVDMNGYINDSNSFRQPFLNEDSVPASSTSEPSRYMNTRMEESQSNLDPISTLKELCMDEGLKLDFRTRPTSSTSLTHKGEAYAQVEIGGQVFGNGNGLTLDAATAQAAEEALMNLKVKLGQDTHKRIGSPRSLQAAVPNKRFKTEFPRVLQRIPPSARY